MKNIKLFVTFVASLFFLFSCENISVPLKWDELNN